MATRMPRTRDGTPATERRGRSPSIGGSTTPQRRSPNTSNRSSPAKSQDSSTTPTNPTKSIPNYLKPTISSSLDASKQPGKKPVLSDSAKLLRRRSFDRPPPPAQSPRTRVSPSPGFRSSSFSGKTAVSSPKPVPDKNVKAQREAGKQQSMYGASAVRKSSNTLKKPGTRDASTSSKRERGISPSAKSDVSSRTDDKESIASEVEEHMVQYESNDEKSTDTEYPVPEDQEIIKTEQQEIEKNDVSVGVKSEDESKDAASDDATNEKVKSISIEQADAAEPEEATLLDGSVEDELKEIEVHQVPEIEMPVSENENTAVEEQVSKNEEQEPKQEVENTPVEEIKKEPESIPVEENKKEPENTPVEEKQVTENVAVARQRMTFERKDSGLSNNVIEETASKLREQRKNKVKALAGAFETVISLQDK